MKSNEKICCTNIETILSDFLVLLLFTRHQFIIWSEIARRRRQLYRLIVRRQFRIYTNQRNATYYRLRVIWLHTQRISQLQIFIIWLRHATNFVWSKIWTLNDIETNCWIRLFLVSLIRLQNRFLTKCLNLYVIMYSNKNHTLHELSYRLSFFKMCKRKDRNCFLVFSKLKNIWKSKQNESLCKTMIDVHQKISINLNF